MVKCVKDESVTRNGLTENFHTAAMERLTDKAASRELTPGGEHSRLRGEQV